MSNSYYNHSTYPSPNAPGSSAALRAELELITAGFAKLPTLSALNANKLVVVNSAGNALIPATSFGSVAIIDSTIDNSPIGATTPSTGKFTSLAATGAVNLGSSVTIAGGTINGTQIGNVTPSSGAFTTVAASSGFTGNLTGNVTGNLTGNVTGNVTGDLTGNVTANSGTSTFNNVTIHGSLDMDAGSAATIINLPNPTNNGDAANKAYVDQQAALKLSLSGGTMSGAIAMGGSKITGLGTPTADTDAATKAYVDGVAQGLDVKGSVRAATTANITLSGAQTIDGVAVIAGDRVLVKDQSSPANNGIYVVASGSWTRATDADAWAELPGAFVFVEDGTVNDNSGWVCTVAPGGTLGVTAITFEQFSGAGQITAGAGLTKSGNTINVGTASAARIVVNADNIDLATTGVTGGTYAGLTVDAYGRVTSATALTTLAGYGIANAYTKTEIDTTVGTLLAKAGGTMSGAIAMGANKITGMADPTLAQDATTKAYVDSILGSATSAAASASAAATSATNAANSATNAATSAGNASTSASNAATSLFNFKSQYLGPLASDPTLDGNGNAVTSGDLYFNTTLNQMRVYDGAAWNAAYLPAGNYLLKSGGTMTGNLDFASGTKITGDFTNATLTSRVMVQTNVANGSTVFGLLPAGTSVNTQFHVWGASDPNNAPLGALTINSGALQIQSTATGTGTILPFRLLIGSTEVLRATTAYNFLIGSNTDNTVDKLQVTGSVGITTNLNFSGTGNRITGDFSNATVASRALVQSSTTNGNTLVGAVPNGTATVSRWAAYNAANPTNASLLSFGVTSTAAEIVSTFNGTGTALPLDFYTGGSKQLTLATTGAGTATQDWTFQGVTVGRGAGAVSTNTAVGNIALYSNTTGARNAIFGNASALQNTTGSDNSVFGYDAFELNTTGSNNTAVGSQSVYGNTTGSYNVGIGYRALFSNTTASYNTTAGYQSAYSNTIGGTNASFGAYSMYLNSTGSNNAAFGYGALYSSTGGNNTAFGYVSGYGVTTGYYNTFVGQGAGYYVTSGYKNTILGAYTGNQGGLDIRTASNYIVLSDGDGNPRLIGDGSGNWMAGTTSATYSGAVRRFISYVSGGFAAAFANTTAGNETILIQNEDTTGTRRFVVFKAGTTGVGEINSNGTTTNYATSSDYRLKENVQPMVGALAKIAALKPVTYTWKSDGSAGEGFIAHELAEVCPAAVTGEKDAVDADGNPQYQGIDVSFLVGTLTAAIQELKADLDATKAELSALKGAA